MSLLAQEFGASFLLLLLLNLGLIYRKREANVNRDLADHFGECRLVYGN